MNTILTIITIILSWILINTWITLSLWVVVFDEIIYDKQDFWWIVFYSVGGLFSLIIMYILRIIYTLRNKHKTN